MFGVLVSPLSCFKAMGPLCCGQLFSKFKSRNCSYRKMILEERRGALFFGNCNEYFDLFYSYIVCSWYERGAQEMVYEPEILVHKSMSSRLRKGETRNNKTLQQIIRTHEPKEKKGKCVPKRNPSGCFLCWCKLTLFCSNLM